MIFAQARKTRQRQSKPILKKNNSKQKAILKQISNAFRTLEFRI